METVRKAEAGLVRLAHRFGNGYGGNNSNSNINDTQEKSVYTMELFDTTISSSVLPFRKDKTCSISNSSSDDDDDEPLTMHAIRVTRNSDQQQQNKELQQHNQNEDKNKKYPLVILHGYMNGALYFYRNLAGLANSNFFESIVSVDLLGWGLSSRPSLARLKDDSVETTEAFFVESLEAWRSANNIEKMTLAGHSMGGYLSVAYCERYPERVHQLLLLSPVGVPEETDRERQEKTQKYVNSVPRKLAYDLFMSLWEKGYTPASLLRGLTEHRGRKLVEGYIERRLPAIEDPHERALLAEYAYTGNVLPGSGDQCLQRILKPGAMAKKPLLRRIPKLDVEKVSFFYGVHDWMDCRGGLDVQQLCLDAAAAADASNTATTPPKVDVYQVKNAGHLLMLENSEGFNNAMLMAAAGDGKIPMGYTSRTTKDDANIPVVLDVRRGHGRLPTSSSSSGSAKEAAPSTTSSSTPVPTTS